MRLLRARRLVERGVRFVRVFIEHQIWDNHLNLDRELGYACAKTDKPVAALIKDLKPAFPRRIEARQTWRFTPRRG